MSSERQEYNENSPWWGEHIHRYKMIYPYLSKNDKILDIACGNGFGSFKLSQHTNNLVIGGDISMETINSCLIKFKNQKNLIFQLIDGTAMNFGDNAFDIIVSFETIEHTTEYQKMVTEFFRTTKSGGIVIISTPNQEITSPDGVINNPFHTQEFNYDRLLVLLNDTFGNVKIYGQKYIRYSNNTAINFKIAYILERILYLRGVRKIPLVVRNKIMNMLIRKNLYPTDEDFELTEVKNEILKCRTFFAVCEKN